MTPPIQTKDFHGAVIHKVTALFVVLQAGLQTRRPGANVRGRRLEVRPIRSSSRVRQARRREETVDRGARVHVAGFASGIG